MPKLTVTVTKEEQARLAQLAGELGKTPKRVAEGILHRNLIKSTATTTSNRQRAADRALRQLELTRLFRDRDIQLLGQAEKLELAARFGVAERTIYRDLIVVERALDLPRQRRVKATGPEPAEALAS